MSKIEVTVQTARNTKRKKGANVYAILTVNSDKGSRIGRGETSGNKQTNPNWNKKFSYSAGSTVPHFSVNAVIWEQHTFSRDKYLGEITFLFYPSKSKKIDSWFTLQSKKPKMKVSGQIKIRVEYIGTVPKSSSSSSSYSSPSNKSGFSSNAKQDRSVLSNTLIDQPFTVVDSKEIEWDSYREGPSEVQMEKHPVSGNNLLITNKGLELNNSKSSYAMNSARSNVKVTSGKWYFEVTLLSSGRGYIGWCTSDYNPKNPNASGDAWSYDGYSNYKRRKAQSTRYGSGYWTTNNVIGCSFDYEKKSMHFYKNGKDVGEAFGVSDLPKQDELMPYVNMAGYMKVRMNFGATPFKYPQPGFNSLHLKLNKTQIAKLQSRFQYYNKKTVEAGYDDENVIHDEGLEELQKDLGIDSDDDIGFLVMSWKLKCNEAWEISLEEWMNGFLLYGCEGMTAIKDKIREWKNEVNDRKLYKQFYNWLFLYFKGDTGKSIPMDEAKILWNLLLKKRKLSNGKTWKLYDSWIEFSEKRVKSVNKNVWTMLYSFMNKYPVDMKGYENDDTCYPAIFDSFYELIENDFDDEEDSLDDDDL